MEVRHEVWEVEGHCHDGENRASIGQVGETMVRGSEVCDLGGNVVQVKVYWPYDPDPLELRDQTEDGRTV
jgi:hypothetical protein